MLIIRVLDFINIYMMENQSSILQVIKGPVI
jgi:hypothetical protein